LKELREILEAAESAKQAHAKAVLVTIVKAKGSTYRRAGARMLMTLKGDMVGSISGGCLEGDVFEHAKKVIQSGEPTVVNYDATSDDDAVWGLGLGCSGVVHVLIESLEHLKQDYLKFLQECVEKQRPGVLATVFRVEGRTDAEVGSHFALQEDGASVGSIRDTELKTSILRDARGTLSSGRSVVKEYQLPAGNAEVFIEAIQPAISLILFGAGHDAIPVVRLAKEIGWNVTVVDSRPAFVSKERFPQADRVILSDSENIGGNVHMDEHSVAVIMTHNYAHDQNILRQLLGIRLRYLGILGPKKRTQKLIQDLAKEGINPADEQLAILHSPAGLDIGAETPEEIALAIVGEIQAVLAGRPAGLLRDRKGSIH
jgi:xanthine dehydrogenase accessory factor